MLTDDQKDIFLNNFYWAARKVIRYDGVDRRRFASAISELGDLIEAYEKAENDAAAYT